MSPIFFLIFSLLKLYFEPQGMDQNLKNVDLKICDDSIQDVLIVTKISKSLLKRPSKCNQCDSTSSQTSIFGRHLKTHSSKKPYKCKQCDFGSAEAGNLKRHMKTHSEDKLHKCNQCDFASLQAGNLRIHLKTHSWDKPFKCSICIISTIQGGKS